MLHKVPDWFAALGLLVGLYALLRLVLWYIFTRHLTKNADERGAYECDGDCLKGASCVNKKQFEYEDESNEQPYAKGTSFWD